MQIKPEVRGNTSLKSQTSERQQSNKVFSPLGKSLTTKTLKPLASIKNNNKESQHLCEQAQRSKLYSMNAKKIAIIAIKIN